MLTAGRLLSRDLATLPRRCSSPPEQQGVNRSWSRNPVSPIRSGSVDWTGPVWPLWHGRGWVCGGRDAAGGGPGAPRVSRTVPVVPVNWTCSGPRCSGCSCCSAGSSAGSGPAPRPLSEPGPGPWIPVRGAGARSEGSGWGVITAGLWSSSLRRWGSMRTIQVPH